LVPSPAPKKEKRFIKSVQVDTDEAQQLQQPIYMEVEDSGYTEDSSSTPSSGNNTNNMVAVL
jgi:hypothetical protein